MSTPETNVIPLHPLRSVEVAKQAERNNWDLADAIFDDIGSINETLTQVRVSDGRPSSAGPAGLTAAEKAVHEAMVEAGVSDFTPAYLHNLFVTAMAWPAEDRNDNATFRAHYLLRSQTYNRNRKQILERLGRGGKKVTQLKVQVWISEHKPRQSYTFLQLVERRIRGSVKGAAAPWHLLADSDRQQIADILRNVAREVEDGTFPEKKR